MKHLLAAALEGGSNYWYKEAKPRGRIHKDFYDDAFDTALCLTVDVSEYQLTMKDFDDGLFEVERRYPMIYKRIVDGTYDAKDADVWLQLTVFNEVLYG